MWPLALANIVREGGDATIWGRLHARQALAFGAAASLAFFVVLTFPLATVLVFPAISITATIVVYTIGLIADALVGILWLALAVRFAARTARGELFSIRFVTPFVDRWFPPKQR